MRSAIGAHRIDGETSVRSAIGTHRKLVRPAIAALTVRSAIGAHRILVRPAIEALTVGPDITALTGYSRSETGTCRKFCPGFNFGALSMLLEPRR